MTRILCVGDIHVMDKPPSGATEEYLPDLISSLEYTVELEKKLNCDAVVWAGDVFHFKQPSRTSHATVLKMIEIVKSYKNLYIVPGNHDISNDRLESIELKQPLGVLYAAGAKKLSGWAADGLPLYGIPWQYDWAAALERTNIDPFWQWEDRHSDGNYSWGKSLLVTHASLYPPGSAPPFEILDVEKFAAEVYEGSVYYGHIHEPHGIYKVDGVTFANMGALSRGSLHEYNIQREIQVALWQDGKFGAVPVPHKPAAEILKVTEHADKKEAKISLDGFLSDVGSSSIEISSVGSVIEHIQAMKGVDPGIKKRAIQFLEDAQ